MKRLIIDFSSLGWTSLMFGKDNENGYEVEHDGKKVFVNSMWHGYENFMTYLTDVMKRFGCVPSDLIFVIEGMNSKTLRRAILPSYKEGSDNRTPAAYEEFNKMKEKLIAEWSAVGTTMVSQDGIEADDVIAYLAKHLDGERIIVTNDGDLAVCVDPENGIHLWRKDVLDENPYGPFAREHITLYKALVGDTSDKIPGAKGYGNKAFLDTLCIFGDEGLDAFADMIKRKAIAKELPENVPELKALQKVVDNEDMVYASWGCAKLYPEKVNTLRKPLQWTPGMVKRRTKDMDERLKPYAGQIKLVHAANYQEAFEFIAARIEETPDFSIDIETSTSEESDMWLERAKGKSADDDDIGVDVFGSDLTGLSLTFGDNRQYTFYFTVDHREEADVKNLTSEQVLRVIKLIPKFKAHVVHNASFELTVLYREWKDMWKDDEWHGFMPNVYDTAIMSSYVDENESRGLKKLSSRLLNYKQDSYAATTTIVFDPDGVYQPAEGEEVTIVREGEMPWPGGRMIAEGDGWEKHRYKMNALTARHVLSYGADDTICTAALFNFFRIIMEIEKTFEVYKEVEIYPAYVTALAFVQGAKCSIERLKQLEKEDDEAHEKAWATFRAFLMEKGWEGTVCPVFDEITPAAIKEAFNVLTGEELKTAVRKLDKLAILLDEAGANLLAEIVRKNDVAALNSLVKSRFKGDPQINFDSPKQMQRFLYQTLGIPVRIVNKLTPNERASNPALAEAVRKHNKIWQGSSSVTLTDEEKELLKLKAATDDTAVDFALAMDATEDQKTILKAMRTLKTVETRRKLYYRPYPVLIHWKDGKLHSHLNQSFAVTRRYTSSGPNLQQQPKKGEGVKVREIMVPHKPNAVICSIDFSGQELRLMAGQSRDENMLACYIGDKLKDIHSITAAGAMIMKWTKVVVDELAERYGAHLNKEDADYLYDLFVTLHKKVEEKEVKKKADDLRKDAKNVNFAAQFDAQAAKLAQMLIMTVAEAQGFLDAKYAMFPRVETWKEEVRDQLMRDGYVTTMMGARRHLRSQILNDDKWIAEKAGRQGPNFKIQGSAAEMTKLAIARLWKSGVLFKLDMQFIAPIHDELVWSVVIPDAMESIKVVHAAMTAQYADLCVPILGSISLGPNFGKQIECGEWVIEENIQKALDEVSKQYAEEV